MSTQPTKPETDVKNAECYRKQPVVPDGGWGWVVCFAAAYCSFIVNGLTSSSGIFLIGLTRIFDDPISTLSLIGALLSGLSMLAAPVASVLLVYFSHRTVIILAGLLGFTGAVLGVFSTNSDMMIVTYGIMSGVSLGISFFTGQIIAGFYFEKKRALAIGISNCGGGMGILVGNMLLEYLIEFYGPRGALLLISGALLNIVVFGSLCRPLQYVYKNVEQKEPKASPDGTNRFSVIENQESDSTEIMKQNQMVNKAFVSSDERHITENLSASERNEVKDESIIQEQEVGRRSLTKRCSNIIGFGLLKNINFVLVMISYVFFQIGAITIMYIAPLAVWSFGISQQRSAILMSLLGIFTTVGNIFVGMLVDLLHLRSNNLYIFSMLIFAITIIMMPYCYSFQYIAPVVCIYSVAHGFIVSLRLVLTTESVGIQHSTKAYSFVSVTSGIAGLFTPPLFGLVYDVTGSFLIVFFGAGASTLIGAVLILVIALRNKFSDK